MLPQPDSQDAQRLWRTADAGVLERRFFERTRVSANGELLWATKKMFGRVTNHRAFLVTENLSRDGAKVLLHEEHHFPAGSRARLKLGIEFTEVEVLGVQRPREGRTALRLTFINPNAKFNRVVEQYLPLGNEFERVPHETQWAGL